MTLFVFLSNKQRRPQSSTCKVSCDFVAALIILLSLARETLLLIDLNVVDDIFAIDEMLVELLF